MVYAINNSLFLYLRVHLTLVITLSGKGPCIISEQHLDAIPYEMDYCIIQTIRSLSYDRIG